MGGLAADVTWLIDLRVGCRLALMYILLKGPSELSQWAVP